MGVNQSDDALHSLVRVRNLKMIIQPIGDERGDEPGGQCKNLKNGKSNSYRAQNREFERFIASKLISGTGEVITKRSKKVRWKFKISHSQGHLKDNKRSRQKCILYLIWVHGQHEYMNINNISTFARRRAKVDIVTGSTHVFHPLKEKAEFVTCTCRKYHVSSQSSIVWHWIWIDHS